MDRKINLSQLLSKKSYFLLGPRSTGKSYWIKHSLGKDVLKINLNETDWFLRLSQQPALLRDIVTHASSKVVVIDEIQKLPILLDEVQNLIEEQGVHFLLTGSSARKLKRENANMLGGRAGHVQMLPLSYSEIRNFDLNTYLYKGGLPRIFLSDDPKMELDAYVSTYLEEEIKAEAHVRNLVPFARFLKAAALNNAQLINYSNISNDCGVPLSTVKEYYSLLQDTLIGYNLEPWLESKKRKAIQTAKFYFFDTGVCRTLRGIKNLEPETPLWGEFFEQFICNELKAYNSYYQKNERIYFWRSVNKQEVDFIVGDEIAIEVKAAKVVTTKMLSGLKALREEKVLKKYFVVSQDPIERTTADGIVCLHWQNFLTQLWSGNIF